MDQSLAEVIRSIESPKHHVTRPIFDVDEMNLHVPQLHQACAEVQELIILPHCTISLQGNKLLIGVTYPDEERAASRETQRYSSHSSYAFPT